MASVAKLLTAIDKEGITGLDTLISHVNLKSLPLCTRLKTRYFIGIERIVRPRTAF